MAEDLLKNHCPPSVVKMLLDVVAGRDVSTASLSRLRENVLLNEHRENEGETTADLTLNILRKARDKDDVKFCTLTASYESATDLVRVRKRGSSTKARQKKNSIGFAHLEDRCTDKEMINYVQAVCKALQITDSGEVLLGVAWSTRESRDYHRKFPYVLGFDVTFGTNNERRPLFRVVSKMPDGRNVPLVNCFMPSQQQHAFEWIFRDALPEVLDDNALRQCSILISDEDAQQNNALHATVNLPNQPYGTRHIVKGCKWHKVCVGIFICVMIEDCIMRHNT